MPDVNITPSENGPYIVSGPMTITAADGHVIEHPRPGGHLPLRRLVEQAVLRWYARQDRLRRNARKLIDGNSPQPEQVDAAKARRSLRNGFITVVLAGALVIGLLLAVPGLKGVATTVST
jgi:hypothetical protein